MKTPAPGESLQGFLDRIQGGCGSLDGGRYQVTETLRIGSGTALYGPGTLFTKGKEDFPLLVNNAVGDADIAIYGVRFEGDAEFMPAGSMSLVGLVEFGGVDGLTLRDCKFRKRWRDLLTLYGNTDILIDGCRFSDWGRVREGQWLGGSGIFCQSPNWHGRIVNCFFRDGKGIPIWLPVVNLDGSPQPERQGEHWIVNAVDIWNCGEAGIVGAPDMTVIANYLISGIANLAGSGHGMELHGSRFVIANGVTRDCANYNIYVSNSAAVDVTGNVMDGKGLAVSAFAAYSGQGDKAPSNITITSNVHIPRDEYAVEFWNFSGDPKNLMRDVELTNCNSGGALVYVADHVRGKGFKIDKAGVT